MATVAFASDRFAAQQLDTLVASICSASPAPSWALADVALLDAGHFHDQARRRGWSSANAYAFSPLSTFEDQAVWLVKLAQLPEQRDAQVRDLLRLANGTTALSWLYCAAPLASLQQLADYLARARIEERTALVHCRFADTRVLPSLLHQLDLAQHARVAAVVDDWGWVDRCGAYVRWRPQQGSGVPDASQHLRLTATQFRAIRAASEPDAIFSLLLEQTPSLVPAQQRGEFHGTLQRILQTADGYCVRDLESRLQFVVLALSCGEDFHRLSALQDTWDGVRAGRFALAERMPLWDNAIWDRLEANKAEFEAVEPAGERP
ncbi:DUF4123 domain-containing protein [Stenotrophomonas sp. MMGLT7]|uniref:DUF4123 domain-containing protein n=1 Tax=Stenotrophomonas sp. MMGLT7 TaxID=2901227 RepID=UPI001E5C8AE2|nr:DUF4123 domain-containing protein [Stenotrophomonas sp. MMGLT7]MCD7100411.1 DUF4123 domain-containing protein [Stenotrophomonas sp. MMGLT7]